MPSAAEARALYRAFLRSSQHFGTSYNIKEYVKRRARDGFRDAAAVSDPAELARLWGAGRAQLEVARRQAIVYDLFSHKHKHAMDLLHQRKP
ncbi:LYR motif-containing 4 [Micractinium conductrix]|uniref:LYR motif-containing 4 n=1 Tax=Micractinium conductrix TaxID=554055 RepID=A0A2P6VEW0_9CHLO|nr:LYR motif-containing 4 [Micractinium conductrix]|eukprot:PSC72611.1 LYR motif-containing 4 [Micractinium conductrix]